MSYLGPNPYAAHVFAFCSKLLSNKFDMFSETMEGRLLKKSQVLKAFFVCALLFSFGCSPSAEQLKQTLEKNPDILFDVLKQNQEKFVEVVASASQAAKGKQQDLRKKQRQAQREEEFKNPKKPNIDLNRAIIGSKNAPITIVEYSDFQCPYCSRGYKTMKEVKEKYGDKVRIVYKHLPLQFHPLAMPAAKYFEAIALQDKKKAYLFHDQVFENQKKLSSLKEKFLEDIAKGLKVNMVKLKKDMESDVVKKRIADDTAEAKKFGITGTPGFLVNGVSIKGAYPTAEFVKVIGRLLPDLNAQK